MSAENCLRKRPFRKRKIAERWIERNSKRLRYVFSDVTLRTYLCPHCGYWHLTKKTEWSEHE